VGSEACRSCHPDRETSFRRTGMGRSMARVDPAREPPDAVFDHPLSKRRYQVCRKEGQVWHRELLLAGGSQAVVLSESRRAYVTGSGRPSLPSVVEADDFLVESPLTWSAPKTPSRMSPGYDVPQQPGFERAAGEGCLVCPAGQSRPIEGSLH